MTDVPSRSRQTSDVPVAPSADAAGERAIQDASARACKPQGGSCTILHPLDLNTSRLLMTVYDAQRKQFVHMAFRRSKATAQISYHDGCIRRLFYW